MKPPGSHDSPFAVVMVGGTGDLALAIDATTAYGPFDLVVITRIKNCKG